MARQLLYSCSWTRRRGLLVQEFGKATARRKKMSKERFKVLLVDDEREFVESLSERLQLRNLDAEVAYDGEQALQALAQGNEPDVMVLDLRMPGIDGIEVLRKVRKNHPEMRVVILTGHGTSQDEQEAKQLGAFEYMEKPVEIEHLDSTLRRAWRSLKQMKERVDYAWMAAGYSEAGQPGYAAEVMQELEKKQAQEGQEPFKKGK
jgi:DNA-binding NtrC family response regulator